MNDSTGTQVPKLALRDLLHYAQKGVRERLSDAAALQRQGFPAPEWLPQVVSDAQRIVDECLAEEVPIEPALARAMTRAGAEARVTP